MGKGTSYITQNFKITIRNLFFFALITQFVFHHAACKRRPSPLPLDLVLQIWFGILYGSGIVLGAFVGSSLAGATKGGTAMKVLWFALGMCIPVSVASFFWCPFACSPEDDGC